MANLTVEKEWITKAGLVAKVIAYPDQGHRCGYVAVPIHSILFGEDYDSSYIDNVSRIEVHGGISYAGKDSFLNTNDKELFWWFGFDCSHGCDGYDFEIMSKEKREKMESGIEVIPCRLASNFRSFDYCEKECENFALGLVDFERKKIECAMNIVIREIRKCQPEPYSVELDGRLFELKIKKIKKNQLKKGIK